MMAKIKRATASVGEDVEILDSLHIGGRVKFDLGNNLTSFLKIFDIITI